LQSVSHGLFISRITSSTGCIPSLVSPVAGGLSPLSFILRSATAGLELVLPCGHPVRVSRCVPVHAVHPVRDQLLFSSSLAITSYKYSIPEIREKCQNNFVYILSCILTGVHPNPFIFRLIRVSHLPAPSP